ncbi:MAG: hypothetical protein FWC28_04175 [Proteobacteria bacterium]|nr:hypothetical protein [Cystobacterineae bacterium]MCL2259231.1 hypothetical protein [Cystobacterineae bacterium]MCL2314434.1 hypothetical protein [Pseudomonadota bacterium]
MPSPLQPAVLLNANARNVGPKISKLIAQTLPQAAVFLSHNLSEAQELARKILTTPHTPVLLGGGDGTLMGFLEALLLASQQLAKPLPELGLLRLGTGNAIARWTGQTHTGKKALQHALRYMGSTGEKNYKSLNLIEFDKHLAPFAGAGVDGRVLVDYVRFKERSSQKPWKHLATGMKAYVASVALHTLPYYLLHPTQIHCQIQNLGETAFRVYPDGSLGPPLPQGTPLFEGKATMVAASTIPFYGYGIRMFPFAQRLPRCMHLRVLRSSIPHMLLHLHSLWKGSWFPPTTCDFVVENVTVSCSKPMPCQVGGDAAGERNTMHLRVSETSVPLMALSPASSTEGVT